ncbi:MAG: chemotaxis protein CheW [Bacillota bacterium]
MTLEFDATPEDLKVFLDEADEQLQLLDEDIVKLEREGEDEELVQEIFRAAHTLKGSSATLGHKRMAELTHAMENVLDKIRKHRLEPSTALVDTLFACVDALRALKDEIVTRQESNVDLASLVHRLADAGADVEGGATVAEPEESGLPSVDWQVGTRLADARERGMHAYLVTAALDMNSAMPSVRAFQILMNLSQGAEVLASVPTLEEVEEEKVVSPMAVLVAAAGGPDAVRQMVADVPDVLGITVKPYDDQEGRQAARPAADAGGSRPNGDAAAPRGRGGRTVRVDVEVLDNLMNLVGELVIDRTRLTQISNTADSDGRDSEITQELGRTSGHIARVTSELQEEIMRARMLPVDNLFKKFPRMMRDLAQKAGKDFDFVMRGEETELDRSVIEEISDPLMHLLRNSVDHGIEPPEDRVRAGKPARGQIVLEASHEENSIVITVRDDGRGIDPEKIRAKAIEKGFLAEDAARRLTEHEVTELIFAPGFSTAEKVTDISGRGVGMDVVHKNIEKLNGHIEIDTTLGKGTEFRVKLPLTLAIIRALLVTLKGTVMAIPLTSVTETRRITGPEIQRVKTREVIVVRDHVIPLLRLAEVFGLEDEQRPEAEQIRGLSAQVVSRGEEVTVVIVNLGQKQMAIAVDALLGEMEVVIKSLGKLIGDVPGISGAAILGDGSVAIILDVPGLVQTAQREGRFAEPARAG